MKKIEGYAVINSSGKLAGAFETEREAGVYIKMLDDAGVGTNAIIRPVTITFNTK